MKTLLKFLGKCDGAVTTDWVVLTAGIVMLGVMVGVREALTVSKPANNLASNISGTMQSMAPTTY